MNLNKFLLISAAAAALFLSSAPAVQAATLSLRLSEPTATVYVGDLFDVSIFLNTEEVAVNAVQAVLHYPPEKLQIVSPSIRQSIIDIWTSQPTVNNQTGEARFAGGIPGGIIINEGLVTTLRFRARAAGSAAIQFDAETNVLANDGLGTEVLRATPGVFLTIQPPRIEGLVFVRSASHSSQSQWYSDSALALEWTDQGAASEAYSYMLDDQPTTMPDTVSEGNSKELVYQNLASGTYYFHIRGLRRGVWGSASHYRARIDTEKPAEFNLHVIPRPQTSSRQPIVKFSTTDAHSGMDHYEINVTRIPESSAVERAGIERLFTNAMSPYVTAPLPIGKYEVILRAYDKAQNYQEVTQRIRIVSRLFELMVMNGIQITNTILIPWGWMWLLVLLLLILFVLWVHHLHSKEKEKKE